MNLGAKPDRDVFYQRQATHVCQKLRQFKGHCPTALNYTGAFSTRSTRPARGWKGLERRKKDNRRAKSMKGAQLKHLWKQIPTKVYMVGKQPCKTENEHGKYFLWPLTTPGRQRGMTNCIPGHQTWEKWEVMHISKRQPRKHLTLDGREAEQRPMKTFHHSLNNTKMLSVGLWVTSGWGWRTKWGLLQRKSPSFWCPYLHMDEEQSPWLPTNSPIHSLPLTDFFLSSY